MIVFPTMAQSPVCWRIEHPASNGLCGWTGVDLRAAGVLCAWVARLDELLQHPQDKQWQRQPEPPRAAGIKPLGCAAMCLVSRPIPRLVYSCTQLQTTKMLYLHFFGGLPDMFSLWLTGLPCLTEHSCSFLSFLPRNVEKTLWCCYVFGWSAEYRYIHALLLKLTDLMAKPIPQHQFEMKGKVPGRCEGQWTSCKGRICPWYNYVGVSWWK